MLILRNTIHAICKAYYLHSIDSFCRKYCPCGCQNHGKNIFPKETHRNHDDYFGHANIVCNQKQHLLCQFPEDIFAVND